MNWIAAFFCDEGIFQGICENIVFVLAGFDEPQTNQTLLETIIHHTPAGASTNTLLHYAQEINSSKWKYIEYQIEGSAFQEYSIILFLGVFVLF